MVAARLTLPRAVEEAIGLREGVLVKRMVPGRLALAAETTRVVGGMGKREAVIKGRDYLRGDKLGTIQFPGHPVSQRCEKPEVASEVGGLTYLGDWLGSEGEEFWLPPGDEADGAADQMSSEPS